MLTTNHLAARFLVHSLALGPSPLALANSLYTMKRRRAQCAQVRSTHAPGSADSGHGSWVVKRRMLKSWYALSNVSKGHFDCTSHCMLTRSRMRRTGCGLSVALELLIRFWTTLLIVGVPVHGCWEMGERLSWVRIQSSMFARSYVTLSLMRTGSVITAPEMGQ